MRKVSKSFSDILSVISGNFLVLLSGIFASFVLPKIMSVSDYGWYKTYALYISYVGIFSVGLLDGVALKYGGYDLSQLPTKRIRAIFRCLLIILCVFTASLLIIGQANHNNTISVIISFCAINIVAINVTGFFQHISQITQRFKEYSFRNIIKSLLSVVATIALLIAYMLGQNITYIIYVIILTLINAIMSIWYVHTYKDYVNGTALNQCEIQSEIKELIRIGFPLMLANLSSMLLLALDRQFVNLLFSVEVYAVYSFAYNMFALVNTVVFAFSSVLYPKLKRKKQESLNSDYSYLISLVMIFVFASLIAYFPLKAVITWYLPKYVDSLIILRVIFPGLVIDSVLNVVIVNYYKILGESRRFFWKSIIVLSVAFICNVLGFLFFKSTVAISIASVITLLFDYLFMDLYISRQLKIKNLRNLFFLLVGMAGFYCISFCTNLVLGFIIYLFFIVLCCGVFHHGLIVNVINTIKVSGRKGNIND